MENKTTEQAINKIGMNVKVKGRVESIIAKETGEALKSFCRQNEEFARAVVNGGSFEECIRYAAGKVNGMGVSDFNVYQSAVEFYFPGAKIEFKMLIHMSKYDLEESSYDSAQKPAAKAQRFAVTLDL